MPSLIPDKATKLFNKTDRLPIVQRRDVDLSTSERRMAQELASGILNGERYRSELAY